MTKTSAHPRFRVGSVRSPSGRPVGRVRIWGRTRPQRWKGRRMREQVEFGPGAGLDQGTIEIGSPGLRLLLPWAPDEEAPAAWERGWPDGPTGRTGNRRRLALVSEIELELARPSAMIVMQQILGAWRS